MTLVFAAALFLFIAILGTMLGTRLYVQPKEAIDRVASAGMMGAPEQAPVHPSLVFRDLVQRLGNVLPASPKEVKVARRRLIAAGYRGPHALKILYGAKVLLGAALPVLAIVLSAAGSGQLSDKLVFIMAAGGAGFLGPDQFVKRKARRRAKEVQRGLANSLDLLVVCVESGLGLDQAIAQVAKELADAHPEIAEEFLMVNLELKAGTRRVEALRNLADRNKAEDLKKLVAVLIQADRFGTGIAPSLRAHGDYMRVQARQVAEEKAAKLGVKLVFPIFFCILPSLFVFTVGPMAVRIVREVIPMMQEM